MAKKRTKKQKQKIQARRSTEYTLTEAGVGVVEAEGVVAESKGATTLKPQKRVESSFGVEMKKLLYQDLRKTGIVTAAVFCILFGIYAYIR